MLGADVVLECGRKLSTMRHDSQRHWRHYIEPLLPIFDLEVSVDMSCGFGGLTQELARHSEHVYAYDPLSVCTAYSQTRFRHRNNVHVCHSMQELKCATAGKLVSAAFSFGELVHFNFNETKSFLVDLCEILPSGRSALLHHSALSLGYTDPRRNPHWRSQISIPRLNRYLRSMSLRIIEQHHFSWDESIEYGDRPGLFTDCITIVKRV